MTQTAPLLATVFWASSGVVICFCLCFCLFFLITGWIKTDSVLDIPFFFIDRRFYKLRTLYLKYQDVRNGSINHEHYVDMYTKTMLADKKQGKKETDFEYFHYKYDNHMCREIISDEVFTRKYFLLDKFRYRYEFKAMMKEWNNRPIPKTSRYTREPSTKKDYKSFKELLTSNAPDDIIKKLHEYFSTHRTGMQIGITQEVLQNNYYINKVPRNTYLILLKKQFQISLSVSTINAAMSSINKDDVPMNVAEDMDYFERLIRPSKVSQR